MVTNDICSWITLVGMNLVSGEHFSFGYYNQVIRPMYLFTEEEKVKFSVPFSDKKKRANQKRELGKVMNLFVFINSVRESVEVYGSDIINLYYYLFLVYDSVSYDINTKRAYKELGINRIKKKYTAALKKHQKEALEDLGEACF